MELEASTVRCVDSYDRVLPALLQADVDLRSLRYIVGVTLMLHSWSFVLVVGQVRS